MRTHDKLYGSVEKRLQYFSFPGFGAARAAGQCSRHFMRKVYAGFRNAGGRGISVGAIHTALFTHCQQQAAYTTMPQWFSAADISCSSRFIQAHSIGPLSLSSPFCAPVNSNGKWFYKKSLKKCRLFKYHTLTAAVPVNTHEL